MTRIARLFEQITADLREQRSPPLPARAADQCPHQRLDIAGVSHASLISRPGFEGGRSDLGDRFPTVEPIQDDFVPGILGIFGNPNPSNRLIGNSAFPAAGNRIDADLSGLPAPLRSRLEDILRSGCLPDMPDRRWRTFITDAPALCRNWGARALALGWSVDELLGFDKRAPWYRVDLLGLSFLLNGAEVTDLHHDRAHLSNKLVFYRRHSH